MKQFSINTKIIYGENALDYLNKISNKNIFLVCDEFIIQSNMVKQVTNRLKDCSIHIFSDIVPDPSIDIVAKGIHLLNKSNADTIIAIGGGSVIDVAKAINEFSVKFKENIKINDFYAIPTTSGTGSELTQFSVITNLEESVKYTLVKPSLLPDFAILDSSLITTVPQKITADTGMDVLTHAIEAYISRDATDFTDAFAEKAISIVFEYLPIAYNENTQIAREKMHNASAMAGIAFNQAGLGVVHSLAHVIGAKYHIAHGRINAMLLPIVLEFNSEINEKSYNASYTKTALKLQKLSKSLNMLSSNTNLAVMSLIQAINNLNKQLHIPKTLKEYGADANSLDLYTQDILLAVSRDICTKSNPIDLKNNQYLKILEKIKQ